MTAEMMIEDMMKGVVEIEEEDAGSEAEAGEFLEVAEAVVVLVEMRTNTQGTNKSSTTMGMN
jgi:hypothetical protein